MPPFRYQPINSQEIERRAKGTSDFNGFFRDEFKMYQVAKGDNFIRVLPPTWDKPTYWGLDIWVHFNIGPDHAAVLCPAKMGNAPCPLCEDRVQAQRRAEAELANDLAPRRRVMVWVLDMRNEREGPLVWPMAPTIDTGISKVAKDRISGQVYHIVDPEQGYNISFDRNGTGLSTKYDGFQRDSRPSSVDPKWLDFIADHPLPDILVVRDAEEIQALYQGILVPRAGQEDRRGISRDSRDSRGRDDRDDRGYDRRDDRRDEREYREPPRGFERSQEERQPGNRYTNADPPRESPPRDPPREEAIQRSTLEEPANVSPIQRQQLDERSLETDRQHLQGDAATTPAEQGSARVTSLKEAFAARRR